MKLHEINYQTLGVDTANKLQPSILHFYVSTQKGMVGIHQHTMHDSNINWLVVSTPLKNMKVNWDDYSQYMGK